MYKILEFDMRYCINRVYATYNNLSDAVSKCIKLNNTQQGLVPEYKYTVSCSK